MLEIVEADLSNSIHHKDFIDTLNIYAIDPMGGGEGLSGYAKLNLASALNGRKNTYVFLAYLDKKAAGLIICMEGFSTFSCKPLLNIHDLVVDPKYRGQGISRMLLKAAEKMASNLNCCKLTLEVLEGNEIARAAYSSFGFDGYELDPKMGKALFLEKKL